ncbi:MAG: class A beta-lactamase [Candidatus Aminicenantes bacterium]|nr:class A beta-lactamase [Candidatus Aminicenantes bacterium]
MKKNILNPVRILRERKIFHALLAACILAAFGFGGRALHAQESAHIGEDPGLSRLEKEIGRLSKGAKGVVGVGAIHLQTGREVYLNKGVRFPMASTYKVPIATKLFSLVDAGKINLNDMIDVEAGDLRLGSGTLANLFDDPGVGLSVLNLIKLMLIISDNSATDLCMRLAGGGAAITQYMKDIGIEGLRVDRPTLGVIGDFIGLKGVDYEGRITIAEIMARMKDIPEEEQIAYAKTYEKEFNKDPRDTTTPEAMALLLKKLWTREILSEASTGKMLSIMKRCETGKNRIRGMLPPGTVVYDKTGTIGGTLNDVGLIELPDKAGTVIVTVTIKESEAENDIREGVIAQISRAIYDYFLFNPEIK